MKGYKVFDKNWRCLNFQYEVGKTYVHKGTLLLCRSGFHFCIKLVDCFRYKEFSPDRKVAEVEALGEVVEEEGKCVTDKLRIVREIPWEEVQKLCNGGSGNTGVRNLGRNNHGDGNVGNRNAGSGNSGCMNLGWRNAGSENIGNYNTGDQNFGDNNTGHGNMGSLNSGNFNRGWWNTGSWNDCNYSSGFFNTCSHRYMFDKPLPEGVFPEFPVFLSQMKVICHQRLEDMDEEARRKATKREKVTEVRLFHGGHKNAYRRAFEAARKEADWDEQRKMLLALPNFDFKIFEKITGITKAEIMEGMSKPKKKRKKDA